MRRVQAFEEEQEPSNTAFEKGDANAREAIENPVIENIGAIDRESPRMTEGMHRHVHVHMIHAEAVMRAAVDRQAATELVGLFVNRPVHLGAERVSETIRRHHRAQHAELGDGTAQFLRCFLRILHRQDRHAFEARIEFHVGLIKPIVVGFGDRHGVIQADNFAVR